MSTVARNLDRLECSVASEPNETCVLANADCKVVLPHIPSQTAHVVIIDPPYGNQTQNNNEWDIAWTRDDWNEIVEHVFRVLKPGGHFIVFSAGKTLFDMHAYVQAAFKSAFGLDPSFYHMIWKHDSNDSCTVHSHIPRSQFEDIMVYFRTGEGKIMEKFGCLTQTDRFFHHTGRSNVIHAYKDDCRSKPEKTVQDFFIEADAKGGGRVSTFDMKPEQLMSYLVRDYSHTDGVVIDFCMRHGITGVAALSMRRRFIGVELDRDAYARAKRRIAERIGLCFTMERPGSPESPVTITTTTFNSMDAPAALWAPVTNDSVAQKTRKRSRKCADTATIEEDRITEDAHTEIYTSKRRAKGLDADSTYDRLSIVGKTVHVGTQSCKAELSVINVLPSIERDAAMYNVRYKDGGKEATMIIRRKELIKVLP